MKSRNRIYPLFLPHAGCPYQCVYCNQRVVTADGPRDRTDAGLILYFKARLAELVHQSRISSTPGELAFYGGTFTSLPRALLEVILDAVTVHVNDGCFSGIRFSTRPDAVTREISDWLAGYAVQTVELGVQSLSNDVLALCGRGYSEEGVSKAAALVHEHGWKLGIQLMVGLPGETKESFISSVSRAILLEPDFVRIYPALVLARTALAEWYRNGLYEPLSLEDAVLWSAEGYDMLLRANIPVARMGLHADPELEKTGNIIAGPYHPSFGYLVRARRWRDRIDRELTALKVISLGKKLVICVPGSSASEVVGHGRENVTHWKKKWSLDEITIRGMAEYPPGSFECIPVVEMKEIIA
jgi:histone acetyltransferase (RNA polymerase elongator complex component)